jgi:peptidoglycan/xylan/chitin deacetylase (PgdA/CDA1 family)
MSGPLTPESKDATPPVANAAVEARPHMTTYRNMPPLTAGLIRTIGDRIAPRAKGGGRLCIINYHRILEQPDPLLASEPNVATFRWQIALLAECFNVMPLTEAVRALTSERMPPRAVAITFDDGYRSTHDLALPILQEFQLPATVFVATGHIEDEGSMWNDIILEAVRRLAPAPIDLAELGLGCFPTATQAERVQSATALTERSKYLAPHARQALTAKLQALARDGLHRELMLSGEMVRKLAANKVEIGGHTVTHPILTRIADDAARREIIDNKQQLEAMIGKPVTLFAYPNGKSGTDYDQRHVQMVKDAGYEAAFTTSSGAATRLDNSYEFPRGRPWDVSRLMFAGRLLSWLSGRKG